MIFSILVFVILLSIHIFVFVFFASQAAKILASGVHTIILCDHAIAPVGYLTQRILVELLTERLQTDIACQVSLYYD